MKPNNRILFTPKQLAYIRDSGGRWNFKVGATRSGKTFVDLRHVIPSQIREKSKLPGHNCILGVTESSVERNILSPMRKIFGSGMVHKVKNKNMCMLFNEPVFVLGAHCSAQTAKLRGSCLKYVYGDEVSEWSPEVFELLKSRLDRPYSRFDGTCNPEGPTHWLKRFLDKSDAFVQYYHIDDNPHIDQKFVTELKREYHGTMYYGRYIEGLWTASDSLIYPQFGSKNITDRIQDFKKHYISVDYGIQNATAMLLIGFSGEKWTVIDEFYHSGKETNYAKTDEEYYNDLCTLLKKHRATPECIIIDPSASSFIQLVKRKGQFYPKMASNNVINGIRNTASAFSLGLVDVHKSCRRLIGEIVQYSWESESAIERPCKKNDHACDALRYFVHTMKIVNSA